MNLILFEPAELNSPLPRRDPRAVHLLDILRRNPGDSFDAGIIDGPRGKGTLVALQQDSLVLAFEWAETAPPLHPITLIVGLPRPQTARDILREATTLGVTALQFVRTDRGDSNYARSTLWSSDEWRRCLIAGAEQAFDTRLPGVTRGQTLADALAALAPHSTRLALDNYEATGALSACDHMQGEVVLALGPERGWSPAERIALRAARFKFVHLGSRVLRIETACIAALTLVRANLGSL